MYTIDMISIPSYEKELILKVLIAFVIGITIGFDRERSGKVAGIRTQMLICVGSALLAGISVHLGDSLYPADGQMHGDPARLMAQIVSGIGFVGAGVILKTHQRVTGVTTAATLWTTAAIGIAIGSGFYAVSIVTTTLVLLLEPIAHLQYKYGLKTSPYALKLPQSQWESAKKMLQNLNIKHKLEDSDGDILHFTIFSSSHTNKILEKHFNQKQIQYEIDELED
jgi:uncharacterized membrane protein YhiD involved in acid resistance